MTPFPQATTPVSAMPILGRGKHRNPSQGACFMEYTSLLAGETFTDQPRCVDPELAAVLRWANDRISDADRPALVPLLGRAIGLAIEPPPKPKGKSRGSAARRQRREERNRYVDLTARLHREVSARFTATLGHTPTGVTWAWSGHGEEVCWLFWDMMSEPTAPARTEDYVGRLIERLHLLHDCYEKALRDLGLPEPVPVGSEKVQGRPQDMISAP
jgi:hypothetical protein